jgi:phosphoglycolate phosphatase
MGRGAELMHLPVNLPPAVIFDLDGTLVDSLPDIAAAMNATLAEDGVAPIPDADIRLMVGEGAQAAVERALIYRGLAADQAAIERLLQRFEPHYIRHSKSGSLVYPGGREVLAALTGAGIACGLCTNKPQRVTDVVMAATGLDRFMGSVIGASDKLPKKPAPDMLLAAIAGVGHAVKDAVMVGDSIADFATARAARVPIILVDFGYSRAPVDSFGADAIISQLSELPKALVDVHLRCR